ncbi:MAG: hypothetical protein Q4E75_01460 [bacterium]|nr:hypothetical protein [bacterium]
MNNSEIKNGRKKYSKLLELKLLYEKCKNDITELEIDSKVQLYLNLSQKEKHLIDKRDEMLISELIRYDSVRRYLYAKQILDTYNDKTLSDSRIVNKSFSGLACRTKDSNNIFIYMGSYDKSDSICIEQNKKIYNLYLDLETQVDKKVLLSDVNDFEENNIVVYLTDSSVYHSDKFYDQLFFDFREKFFENIIKKGQEEVVSEIKNRKAR